MSSCTGRSPSKAAPRTSSTTTSWSVNSIWDCELLSGSRSQTRCNRLSIGAVAVLGGHRTRPRRPEQRSNRATAWVIREMSVTRLKRLTLAAGRKYYIIVRRGSDAAERTAQGSGLAALPMAEEETYGGSRHHFRKELRTKWG